jgi:hypothetical protein
MLNTAGVMGSISFGTGVVAVIAAPCKKVYISVHDISYTDILYLICPIVKRKTELMILVNAQALMFYHYCMER